MNFYDILLARALCCKIGSEEVPLEVTENGQYIAPEGKAFNPVTVNVSGGGGGDFSTAKATVKNNTTNIFMVSIPYLFDAGEYGVYLNPMVVVNGNEEKVLDVVLYKNAGSGYINTNEFGDTIAVSGDAEYDNGIVDFTGDFTITYSVGQP